MPDLFFLLRKRITLVAGITLATALISLVVSLLQPKLYAATATALPANSATADRGRLFNNNIEALYPELGSVDELDRVEGLAKLDTLYLSLARRFALADAYGTKKTDSNRVFEAALTLRKRTKVRRTAYGELTLTVWDESPSTAASLANAMLQQLNNHYRAVATANNTAALQQLQADYAALNKKIDSLSEDIVQFRTSSNDTFNPEQNRQALQTRPARRLVSIEPLLEQQKTQQKLIDQYELSLQTAPNILLATDYARPPLQPDRPKAFRNLLFAVAAALLFSILLVVYLEGRKARHDHTRP